MKFASFVIRKMSGHIELKIALTLKFIIFGTRKLLVIYRGRIIEVGFV